MTEDGSGPSGAPQERRKVRMRSSDDEAARQLPKRFFKNASARPVEEGGYQVLLDERAVKTPKREFLVVPTLAYAEAIAAEWDALGDTIDPARLAFTKLANTTIDGVKPRLRDVHDDILRFIGNDLLLYRAERPEGLVAQQNAAWDPVLNWFHETYDAKFKLTAGVMPIEQSPLAVAKAASAVADFDAFALAPLHVMTTLTGSALLAIAHARDVLSLEAAWAAAHVDEDWQIARWGEDAEAAVRRDQRLREMETASRALDLLGRRGR